jgi:hypothetical protein
LAARAGRERRSDVGDVAERRTQEARRSEGPGRLRDDVGTDARPREAAHQSEGNADGRVEMGARDAAGGVDHRHDHESEGQRDPDLSESAGLGVDHDRAAAGEDERERADGLGEQPGDERAGQL